ncbi:Aromatic hydroxylase fmpF like protein [Verticillium longisporum]|uniref:Aromatic hydroxylase fmpF like protein n=1 Tax=Verticillium longisporum TaxID=100787 RepID=A0A8I2ZZF4_VERLO|nr:Aromatic hydroxylase fmpF like protein [Verticillium longisporum]KAG7140529.1 Aromatic hydroxylase fmpF like protein [Verticillium longisporum]
MGSISRGEINVDLVVVGGGPTGLLTGYLCEQLGVNVCILDAKAAPLAIGRADALNARTQQYLEVVGILDELLPEGITCNTSSTFADGEFKSRQSHWWTSLKHTHRKNFLMLGQPLVEKVLSSRMTSPVLYGEHVISINEGDEDVVVETSGGRTIRSRYVVGADGARSTVRTALGVNFTGTKPEMTWAVLDTFIDTDFPVRSEIVTFQLNQESRVAWIPRERDLARFYVLLEGEITEERAKESIRAHMAPHRVDFVWTEWFIKERIASTFVTKEGRGRVILAGDAAHVHSVNGGQGLNTGIADAFGLAWRLAHVLTNKTANKLAAQDLIKSYDTERRSYVSAIERNAGYITGMGVSYDGIGSKLIHDSSVGIWTAGHRCPDLYLMPTLDAEAKRLYSLLSYGRHLILHVGRPESRAGGEANRAISDGVARTFRVLPRPEGVEAHADVSPGVEVFWANWVRPTDNYVVIARPDLYVGFVGDNGQEWRNYLSYLT